MYEKLVLGTMDHARWPVESEQVVEHERQFCVRESCAEGYHLRLIAAGASRIRRLSSDLKHQQETRTAQMKMALLKTIGWILELDGLHFPVYW